jgi:hypothetical protein
VHHEIEPDENASLNHKVPCELAQAVARVTVAGQIERSQPAGA